MQKGSRQLSDLRREFIALNESIRELLAIFLNGGQQQISADQSVGAGVFIPANDRRDKNPVLTPTARHR